MKLKKNGKCSNCRKTETVTIYDEPNPQLEICLPCRLKNVRNEAKDIREALEKLKKENKELYKIKIQECKLAIAEWDKLKTEYPELKSQLEEVKQEVLKMIPEEERSEVGGEKPTNWMPWIIGGSILVGAIVIGLVAYFWWKSSQKES